METHIPKVDNSGGPWAEHDVACPVLGPKYKAVLCLNTGIFHPSWTAQKEGWMTIKPPKFLRPFLRRYQDQDKQ